MEFKKSFVHISIFPSSKKECRSNVQISSQNLFSFSYTVKAAQVFICHWWKQWMKKIVIITTDFFAHFKCHFLKLKTIN